MKVKQGIIEKAVRDILWAIGEDPDREGLVGTPGRVARFWAEFIDYNPGTVDRTFEVVETDQMVVVAGMKVWSLCEHHLLPFWCDVSVGYIARDRVLGLSKFARIAKKYAHGLQLQERLVHQIADDVQAVTGSDDVAVYGIGQHLCMVMRGVETPAHMKTGVMRGVFLEKPEARAEFMAQVGQ